MIDRFPNPAQKRRRIGYLKTRVERYRTRIWTLERRAKADEEEIRRLEIDLRADPTHAWHDWPELRADFPVAANDPTCRRCRHLKSSDRGRQPCPGDRHYCPHEVPAGTATWAQTYEDHMAGRERCRRPGRFQAGFTVWVCEAGHRTRWRWRCRVMDCPCPDMEKS